MVTSMKTLVDAKAGLIDRRIWCDKDIYQQELEQVFGRSWLVVGHESQIPNNNDFVANYMGEDPVLLTRDSKGKLHTFLNMCRHRGNRICRADAGNAPSFMCTYHGWTFATDGKLVGVPGYKEAYFEELDRSQWGLVEAPKVDSYRGMVFANWDAAAPTLRDYLGDLAWYMDVSLDRKEGGTMFIAGMQRWTIGCNWKFPADNVGGDGYHTPITHGSLFAGGRRGGTPWKYGEGGWQVSPGNGHAVVRYGDNAYASVKPGDKLPENPLTRYEVENLPEIKARLGSQRAMNANSAKYYTIFPNMSGSVSIRLWHPRGPEKTEIWLYVLADKNAPEDVKRALRRAETLSHGPDGIIEMDDGGNYIQSTENSRTYAGKFSPVNIQMGSGHEKQHEDFPGNVLASPGEANQRAFYGRWAEFMDASSWANISIEPRTKM